jgi:diguanylate cyclase
MAAGGADHGRTIALAEVALDQIKALRLPAEPRIFEIWYHYATGYNPALNKLINAKLERTGALTVADLDEVYNTYFTPTRVTDRIEEVNAKVVDEIGQVMAMVDAAVGSTTSYGESLATASQQLGQAKDREGLRLIVESVLQKTHEIEHANHGLEARLRISKQEISELQANLEAVRAESLTDPVTSLANRKYFDETLKRLLEESSEGGPSTSLLMIDIDHFKSFNDKYGHLTGDEVLRLVGQCMKQNLKGQDIASRYGGEEFAVILPKTDARQAMSVAEQLRSAVMTKQLMKRSTGENLGKVTISLGVATQQSGDTAQTLIGRADACLYAAKHAGRNRAVGNALQTAVSEKAKRYG